MNKQLLLRIFYNRIIQITPWIVVAPCIKRRETGGGRSHSVADRLSSHPIDPAPKGGHSFKEYSKGPHFSLTAWSSGWGTLQIVSYQNTGDVIGSSKYSSKSWRTEATSLLPSCFLFCSASQILLENFKLDLFKYYSFPSHSQIKEMWKFVLVCYR